VVLEVFPLPHPLRQLGLHLIEGPRHGEHPQIGVGVVDAAQIGQSQAELASHVAGLSDPSLLVPPAHWILQPEGRIAASISFKSNLVVRPRR
jgi:hypothetical protein